MVFLQDIDLAVIDDLTGTCRAVLRHFVHTLFRGGSDDDLLGHARTRFAFFALFCAVDAVLALMTYGKSHIRRVAVPKETILAEDVGWIIAQIRLSHQPVGRREVRQFVMSVPANDEGDSRYLLARETLKAQGVIGVQAQQQSCFAVRTKLRSAHAARFIARETKKPIIGCEVRRRNLLLVVRVLLAPHIAILLRTHIRGH